MKRYLFSQWIKRISTIAALLLFVFGIGYSVWYLFSKPSQSKITLTNFSQISFDNLDCDSFAASTTPFAFKFPLSLSYQPDQASLFLLNNDAENYLATLKIENAEHVFVTSKRTVGNEETSNETKLLAPNQNIVLDIKADRFRWSSSISSSAFDDVKNIISLGAFPDYSSVTCDYMGDCSGDPIEEFAWTNQDQRFTYSIGLCGENLRYITRYEAGALDAVNSAGIDIVPLNSGKTAWIMSFTDYIGDDFDTQTREDTIVRVIFNPPSSLDNGNINPGNYPPSINILFTKLSVRFKGIDEAMSSTLPGLIRDVEYLNEQKAWEVPSKYYYFPTVKEIGIKAKKIIVDLPQGAIVANFPKTAIPENADKLTIYSTFDPLNITFQDLMPFNKKYEITGKRIGATIDGKEFLPSPWESFPREIQVAYITVFIPLLAAIIGFGIQKRKNIDTFFDWLFSIPRYRRPVRLHSDANIFRLTNGKRISGIIDRFEGKTTFRVFVLKEVREWDKDNWSDVLPAEVRVPQNQIEMYYKAHP
jgi:hypothetical protein